VVTAPEPAFACDAMLGALARWLRAAGYDASWQADIDDWELIRRARREGRRLLTSDTGIFRVGIVRDGDVPALWVPHGLSREGQLAFVLDRLNLPVREPRCMACGGRLESVLKDQVRDRAPPRSFEWVDQFYECGRCRRLFWRGTHWQHIGAVLQQVRNGSGQLLSPWEQQGFSSTGARPGANVTNQPEQYEARLRPPESSRPRPSGYNGQRR
jgi:uncharacterized protein